MPMFEYVRVIAYHSCQSCTPRNVITIIYIYIYEDTIIWMYTYIYIYIYYHYIEDTIHWRWRNNNLSALLLLQTAPGIFWGVFFSSCQGRWVSVGRWLVFWSFWTSLSQKYPLVNIQTTIEHGHRNSGFSHKKWWCSMIFHSYVNLPEGMCYAWNILNSWAMWKNKNDISQPIPEKPPAAPRLSKPEKSWSSTHRCPASVAWCSGEPWM